MTANKPVGMDIRATGLRKSYNKRTVVDVAEVHVEAGRTLALLGPSGAGKSTLLAILGLLERPDAGTIELDGREVTHRDTSARMHMAAAFQSPYLFKGTVADNVSYGLRLRRVPVRERRAAVAESLERVGLGGWEDRSALTLSGGEAQRVALARALVLRPRVLLLDEPLSSLDPLIKAQLARDFSRIIRDEAMTAIYVTHDQNEAMAVADTLMIMRDGVAVAHGCIEEITGLPPDGWTATFLGTEAPVEGVVVSSEEGLIGVDIGGAVVYAAGAERPGTPVFVGVRPEDVLLFEGGVEIPTSTARNRFTGTVVDVHLWGAMYHIVIDVAGSRFASRVSRASVREMDIHEGSSVQVVFKASAVRVGPATSTIEGRGRDGRR